MINIARYLLGRLTLLLAVLLAGGGLIGGGAAMAGTQHHPRPVPPTQVVAPDIAHPALWQVQNGATTIYLFGTVHALPADVRWFDGPLATAFDRSDTLVTEIIEKSPEDMRRIVFAKAMLPEGQSLRAMLPPTTRHALEKALKTNGLPTATFDRFRPWYAAVALSTLPLMKSGFDPANGVDTHLSKRAADLGRTHDALETAEYQLGLFDTLPMAVQKRYLKEVAVGAPKITRELSAMIRAWKAGNANKLAQLMNADESDARLADVLLYNRNRAWSQWIKARLDKPGTVFIAVGAGHLAGKGSVQDELKKLGIAATRVQ
jgi:uncharacterized protein YbaP (TraB family)